jgi:hypothetical protein
MAYEFNAIEGRFDIVKPPTVGQLVVGSSANSVLFADGSTNLGIDSNFTYSTTNGLALTGNKINPFNLTREKTSTTINHGGGYGSSASTITVADASGFAVNDKVTIETTVSNALSFTWYEYMFDLVIQSISSNDITFTTTIGKNGCNNGDRVLKQSMVHGKITQTGDTSYMQYVAHSQTTSQKSINYYASNIAGIPTPEGYTGTTWEMYDQGGIKRIQFGYGKLGLTKSDGTLFDLDIRRGVGGFNVVDNRLIEAGTGRMRVVANLAEGGILLGMPMTDAGGDDVYQQTRGGSIQVVGDTTGRDAFRVNHNKKYNVTIGSANLGSYSTTLGASLSSGGTTVTLPAGIEPRYGFTFLGDFTTGATVTITETAKATTTSVITVNREAGTLTLTTPAADNYTTAAVITQQKYTPNFSIIEGVAGTTNFNITGSTGDFYTLGKVIVGASTNLKTAQVEVAHTYTDTSGDVYGMFNGVAFAPTSASSAFVGAMGFVVNSSGSQNMTSQIKGIDGVVFHDGTGTLAQMLAANYIVKKTNTGPVTAAYGINIALQNTNATGAITLGVGAQFGSPTTTGAITNMFALYILNQGSANTVASAAIFIDDQSGSSGLSASIYSKSGLNMFNVSQTAASDFTILGQTDANLFFIDVSADGVAIGTSTAAGKLVVDNGSAAIDIFTVKDNGNEKFVIEDGGTIDISGIAAGTPNLRVTATSDTPTTTYTGHVASTDPAGYIEITVSGNSRYIPFFT